MADGTAGTFTVEQVIGDTREFTSAKRGKQVSQKLQLAGRADPVELVSDPTDPAPKEGDTIEGTIYPSNNDYPDKLYRKRRGNGGGGGGGWNDPARIKRDEAKGRAQGRAHAQEMAILAHRAGWRTRASNQEPPDVHALKELIDWFYDDAQAAQAEDYRK